MKKLLVACIISMTLNSFSQEMLIQGIDDSVSNINNRIKKNDLIFNKQDGRLWQCTTEPVGVRSLMNIRKRNISSPIPYGITYQYPTNPLTITSGGINSNYLTLYSDVITGIYFKTTLNNSYTGVISSSSNAPMSIYSTSNGLRLSSDFTGLPAITTRYFSIERQRIVTNSKLEVKNVLSISNQDTEEDSYKRQTSLRTDSNGVNQTYIFPLTTPVVGQILSYVAANQTGWVNVIKNNLTYTGTIDLTSSIHSFYNDYTAITNDVILISSSPVDGYTADIVMIGDGTHTPLFTGMYGDATSFSSTLNSINRITFTHINGKTYYKINVVTLK